MGLGGTFVIPPTSLRRRLGLRSLPRDFLRGGACSSVGFSPTANVSVVPATIGSSKADVSDFVSKPMGPRPLSFISAVTTRGISVGSKPSSSTDLAADRRSMPPQIDCGCDTPRLRVPLYSTTKFLFGLECAPTRYCYCSLIAAPTYGGGAMRKRFPRFSLTRAVSQLSPFPALYAGTHSRMFLSRLVSGKLSSEGALIGRSCFCIRTVSDEVWMLLHRPVPFSLRRTPSLKSPSSQAALPSFVDKLMSRLRIIASTAANCA